MLDSTRVPRAFLLYLLPQIPLNTLHPSFPALVSGSSFLSVLRVTCLCPRMSARRRQGSHLLCSLWSSSACLTWQVLGYVSAGGCLQGGWCLPMNFAPPWFRGKKPTVPPRGSVRQMFQEEVKVFLAILGGKGHHPKRNNNKAASVPLVQKHLLCDKLNWR